MKTYVVSLKDASERRAFMSAQLKELGIQFEFFDAIWGKDFYDDENYFARKPSYKYEKRLMLPGEIGCALSHLEIYKKMISENIPFALILEDDSVLSPDIVKVLPEIEKHIKQNQLINLAKCDLTYKRNRIHLCDDYYISVPYMVKYGSMATTTGYIITKEAAEKILSINFPVYIPADSWGRYRKIIDFRGVTPTRSLIHTNMEFESTIVSGVRDMDNRDSVFSLLFYNFYTQWAVGRLLKRIYQLTVKRWCNK